MSTPARRINWLNTITVISAAILIGTEIFVAAIVTGWAVAGLLGFGEIGAFILEALCAIPALMGMRWFIRAATKVEPILEPAENKA